MPKHIKKQDFLAQRKFRGAPDLREVDESFLA